MIRIAELARCPNPAAALYASMVVMVGKDSQLLSGSVKPTAVHASEAVAEAEIWRAHELVVARVGDNCASAVRPAISGMTVAAETTIDQTNRKNRGPEARSL